MSDVTPERVLRALRKEPKLLSGVVDLFISEKLMIPPEPPPRPFELVCREDLVGIGMGQESEVVVLKVDSMYPSGYYFVEVVGVQGSSPQGRFSLYSRHGLEARQVALSRSHLAPETFVGIVGFSESESLDRMLTIRGKPMVEGIPMTLFPNGGFVKIQWIGDADVAR